MQNRQTKQIDDQTADRDPHHQPALNFRRIAESVPGLVDDEKRNSDQRCAVHQRRKNLSPVVTERPLRARWPVSNPDSKNAQRQRSDVRKHVPGVSEQRQRVADQPADNLRHHITGSQNQRQQ